MRIPRSLAWVLILASFFTAALLRTHHLETPRSPWVPAPVGSLLFACVLFLVLVSLRERGRAAGPGTGVRLGSLTPLLLMLLVEKWASINLYRPAFALLVGSRDLSEAELDATWRAFAAAGLLLVTLVVAGFSMPAARRTWDRARAGRFPTGVGVALVAVACSYASLAAIGSWRLDGIRLAVSATAGGAWILVGQSALAFAEELYYRGLLLHEVFRLGPRLGLRAPLARRWTALLLPASLFALEHLSPALDPGTVLRETAFALAIGLLFGVLVLLTENLWIPALLHAWVNALLLGAAPRIETGAGEVVFGAGLPVAAAMCAAVVASAWVARRRARAAGL